MTVQIAIVGPGRVGQALGRRLAAGPQQLLGFVGRDAGSAARAAAAVGCGRDLQPADLHKAHLVLVAVPDPMLAVALAELMPQGSRPCQLWVHTSGCHGLEVFPAAAQRLGLRCGVLHPAAPIASPAEGARLLAGAPAVYTAGPRAERLLRRLIEWLGMFPVAMPDGDRMGYHAGCALAANGLTALCGAVESVLAAAGGLDAAGRRLVAGSLLQAALAASLAEGPAAALSGPVRRGDAATVAAHLGVLARLTPHLLPVYRSLMAAALPLAQQAGLAAGPAAAVAVSLAQSWPGSPDQPPTTGRVGGPEGV